MINFVLCDDNIGILKKIEKMLENIFIKHDISAKITLSTPHPQTVINYIENNKFDVVILDIDLKSDISGLYLAHLIRQKNKKVYIIFTTAHLEYSMVAYKYKTFDFIAKPITTERLEETILRLYDDIYSDSYSFFRLNKKNSFLKNDDIFFIQKEGKKAIFKTGTQDYEINSSFSSILNHLPNNFVRCHKSYIVNLDKISSIQANNTIIFKDNFSGQNCYIGPKYEDFFMEVVKNGNATKCLECIDHRR